MVIYRTTPVRAFGEKDGKGKIFTKKVDLSGEKILLKKSTHLTNGEELPLSYGLGLVYVLATLYLLPLLTITQLGTTINTRYVVPIQPRAYGTPKNIII